MITAGVGKSLGIEPGDMLNSVGLERIKTIRKAYSECLDEAERWFSVAADFHFRLEEIYTKTMDFDKIDVIFNQKCDHIMSLLS